MIRLKPLLETVLAERVSDVVFHTTAPHSFMEIVNSDTFRLSPIYLSGIIDKGWAEENNLRDHYYMSVARSVTSDYILEFSSSNIVFRLDGRKLNANLKSVAFDYSGEGERRGIGTTIGDEMEDRIVSKKPEIKGFSKYVTGIYVPARLVINSAIRKYTDELTNTIRELTDKGIELYVCGIRDYLDIARSGDTQEAFKSLRKGVIPTFNSKCKTNIDDFTEMVSGLVDYYK